LRSRAQIIPVLSLIRSFDPLYFFFSSLFRTRHGCLWPPPVELCCFLARTLAFRFFSLTPFAFVLSCFVLLSNLVAQPVEVQIPIAQISLPCLPLCAVLYFCAQMRTHFLLLRGMILGRFDWNGPGPAVPSESPFTFPPSCLLAHYEPVCSWFPFPDPSHDSPPDPFPDSPAFPFLNLRIGTIPLHFFSLCSPLEFTLPVLLTNGFSLIPWAISFIVTGMSRRTHPYPKWYGCTAVNGHLC